MLFDFDFANDTIYHASFFFLIIHLLFLIAAVVPQIFNPISELVIPNGIPTKEPTSEIEIHSVLVEPKIRKCSI